MAYLLDPHFQVNDADGIPLAGATLAFYLAGTTTPITVYADAGATTPLTNPVVANSAGTFPPIFLALTGNYKFVLKTATGITIQTADNIPRLDEVSDGDKGDITVSGGGTIWNIDDAAIDEPMFGTGAVSTRALAGQSVTLAKLADAVLARIDQSRPSQGRARLDYWTDSSVAAFVPASLGMNGFRMFGNNQKSGRQVKPAGGAGRKIVSMISNIAYENVAAKLNWYAVFAVADSADAACSFVVAPFLRAYSVAGNIVTLAAGGENTTASPATKSYNMNNNVLAGAECLIISEGANWSGRVATITANTGTTITLDNVGSIAQLNYMLPAPPGWDEYVYLGSFYHENGASPISGDIRNLADTGTKTLSYGNTVDEFPVSGAVTAQKVRLGGLIPPLASGAILSPNGTLSTSSTGDFAMQFWHDSSLHGIFRLYQSKEAVANLSFNQMAEVTFSREQAIWVNTDGTMKANLVSASCLVYGWIEP